MILEMGGYCRYPATWNKVRRLDMRDKMTLSWMEMVDELGQVAYQEDKITG